jgi:acetyl esterase/lipase
VPLDPTAEVMIQAITELGLVVEADSTPEQRRAAMNRLAANPNIVKHPVHGVDDRTVPTPIGPIPVRVYRPSAATGLPVLVFFHGGGWVTCGLDTHDQLCRQLCDAVGCVVLSVDYRLAPETKFPGAADDCLAAYDWATRHAHEIGGDTARLAIGGDSAGGNLAAVTALLARERQLPPPRLQLLIYPVTDREFESDSMIDNAKGYFLESESMRWFWDHYSRTPADFDDWRFSPLRAESLGDLPRAVVVTAEYDPLRDQGEAYGRRLQDDHVRTEIVRGAGLFHGFFGLHALMPAAQEAWDVAVAALRDALEVE